MKNVNEVKTMIIGVSGIGSAIVAWLFAKLGILLYVLALLTIVMFIDYITGMTASKSEAIDHPDDPNYGWNSKKGAKGIFKKFGYICVIAVAMIVDYVILHVAKNIGIETDIKAFFGLMVTVWYLLNEALSIIENVGRMGTPIPEWLRKYIAVLKNKIEQKEE